jgi:hypothetical protein
VGINEFKKSYQPKTNRLKDKKCGLVTGSHNILARWQNHSCQLLNVNRVNDIRQTETLTTEPLVPKPSAFEIEMVIEKLKRNISPGTDQIPT